MKTPRHSRRKQSESGIALLIAIFALMLISAVAISLIVASGTESSLAGNYRSSTSVYYAGFAGLEEARGRVGRGNPNYFDPTAGAPLLPVGTLRYIVNPAPGEIGGATMLVTYPDTEYDREFGAGAYAAAIKTTTNSVSTVAGIPGPLYKWVRINAATERSLNINVNGGGLDNATPLFYNAGLTPPSLIVPPNPLAPPPTARQALKATALAVLPNGSQKTVQYVIAPVTVRLRFPGAITMVGSNPDCRFQTNTDVHGEDQAAVPEGGGPAFALTDPNAVPGCQAAAAARGANLYTGTDGQNNPTANPSIFDITQAPYNWNPTNPDLRTSAGLQELVDLVRGAADQTNPPDNLPTYGQCNGVVNNPMVTVFTGDFRGRNFDGCGVLLVMGRVQWSGNITWRGVILTIGEGYFDFSGGGTRDVDGSVLIAKIYDAAGNLLPQPTAAFWNPSGGTNHVNYDSGWINNALNGLSREYQILSFREISQ